MNHRHQGRPRLIGYGPVGFWDGGPLLTLTPPYSASPGLGRHPYRDAVEPCWKCLPDMNRRGPPNQREKDRLESVFGIGMVRQKVPADGPDERAMAAHQFLEGPLVPVPREAGKQVSVGCASISDADNRLEQRWVHHN